MAALSAFRQENQKFFPLKSITDVVKLFRHHLEGAGENNRPDLTLLSIVSGIFENTLTSSRVSESSAAAVAVVSSNNSPATIDALNNFPVVKYETIEGLYKKFQGILNVDVKQVKSSAKTSNTSAGSASGTYATREIIKKISDIIWNSLARSSYKDRAHLQSLYSYLTGNKLDCFGVAFAVVAGCQILGYHDAHLAMSEDHVWVVFGKNGDETIEVTWHGKGSEDKRGQPVSSGIESHSWLYLSGNPVVCTRHMEVAALVSAINPQLNMTSTCQEVEDLQKQLLWLLYDLSHLKTYPMALGTLGELEEAAATVDRPSCEDLFEEAVNAARLAYKNHHVYPYTYQGCYYYRKKNYRDAFASWANAGDVIRLYNYSRDDEEIYKEFLEIANDTIPQIMKLESSGHSAKSIIRDSQCFANLLRFYDGICQWEEGSLTPILHIGWAKPLVSTIAKFDYDIRSQIIINCIEDDEEHNNAAIKSANENANDAIKNIDQKSDTNNSTIHLNNNNNNNNNIDVGGKKDKTLKSATIKELTAACGEKILNPEFLLQGGGQPFTESDSQGETSTLTTNNGFENEKQFIDIKREVKSPKVEVPEIQVQSPPAAPKMDISIAEEIDLTPKRPVITLYSQKMKGLKDLLLAERLNTHAISLQVTAQSQVQVGGKKGRFHFSGGYSITSDFEGSTRAKRNRRE